MDLKKLNINCILNCFDLFPDDFLLLDKYSIALSDGVDTAKLKIFEHFEMYVRECESSM